jgi:hypothetical protein
VPPGAEVRRDRAEVERALSNFRTLVRYLRDGPELEPTTVAALARRWGRQLATVPQDALVAAAEETLRTQQIAVGPASAFSPAELLLGWADGLVAGMARDRTPRRDVLGPAEAPPLAPERPFLSSSQVVGLAREIVAYGEVNGRLPPALPLDGAPVGLGVLYGALARAYLALVREGAPPDEIELDLWPRYPAVAVGLDREFRRCAEDPLARPGLSTDALALQGRLQSWTLKAAMRSA